MPNIGPFELVIILVLALLILGPGRLPDVGAALGKTIREFRKASLDVQDSMRLEPTATTTAPAAAPVTPAMPAPAETAEQAHIRMLEERLAALEKERSQESDARASEN